MSYRMVTFANTPKGRAGLKPGDWLHFGVKPPGKLVSGDLLRLDPDEYVLRDGGITIVVPFALVLYAMRASRRRAS